MMETAGFNDVVLIRDQRQSTFGENGVGVEKEEPPSSGCCGTGAEHIRAIADSVRGLTPERRAHTTVRVVEPEEPSVASRRLESSLAAKLEAGEFVRVVQLDPPKGTNLTPFLDSILKIKGRVDGVAVTDGANAIMRMTPLAPCRVLIEKNVELGSMAAANGPVASLVSTDAFHVRVSIPESRLGYLDVPGAEAQVRVASSEVPLPGRVISLLGDLD